MELPEFVTWHDRLAHAIELGRGSLISCGYEVEFSDDRPMSAGTAAEAVMHCHWMSETAPSRAGVGCLTQAASWELALEKEALILRAHAELSWPRCTPVTKMSAFNTKGGLARMRLKRES